VQKNLKQLKATCNWLIFLEILYLLWSVYGLMSGIDIKAIAAVVVYGACLFLFNKIKNRISFTDIDETSLALLKPSDMVPNGLVIVLLIAFGIHFIGALYFAFIGGSTVIMLLLSLKDGFFNSGSFSLYLTIFALSTGILVAGIIFFVRLFRFKSLPTLAGYAS
jgi:hypothetical protein